MGKVMSKDGMKDKIQEDLNGMGLGGCTSHVEAYPQNVQRMMTKYRIRSHKM